MGCLSPSDPNFRVIIYARVSTKGQTTLPQLLELRAYAASRGWKVAEEIEDVCSGKRAARPGLDRLMAMVRAREVDCVMVVKIDRMGRSLRHLADIVTELRDARVTLIAPSQGIDTSPRNPTSDMLLNMLIVFAEFERSLISERTISGLEAAREEGRVGGRPSPRLVANWREVVAKWRERERGTFRELAAELGGVSISTAHAKWTEVCNGN